MRPCVSAFGGYLDKFLPLCEFSYNNSYHSIIDMEPFKALYWGRCRSPIGWFEFKDVKPLGIDSVDKRITWTTSQGITHEVCDEIW